MFSQIKKSHSWFDIYTSVVGNNVTERSFKSSFHLNENALSYLYEKYCSEFSRTDFLMFINFLVEYEVLDQGHVKWRLSKQTYINKIYGLIYNLHSTLKEIDFEDRWKSYVPRSGIFKYCTLLWDVFECPIQSPSDQKLNRLFNSGKKRQHTFKYDLAVRPQDGRICWIGVGMPGSAHDITIFRMSFISDYLLEGEVIAADKALQGIYFALVPFTKPLNGSEKDFNYYLDSYRTMIEQVNSRFKMFKNGMFFILLSMNL